MGGAGELCIFDCLGAPLEENQNFTFKVVYLFIFMLCSSHRALLDHQPDGLDECVCFGNS